MGRPRTRTASVPVELRRGVHTYKLKSGEVRYVVTHGSPPDRRVFKGFVSARAANAWKEELERCDREPGRPYPDLVEWSARRDSAASRAPGVADQSSSANVTSRRKRRQPRQLLAFLDSYNSRQPEVRERSGARAVALRIAIIRRFLREHYPTIAVAQAAEPIWERDETIGDHLARWLAEENYDRSTASGVLATAKVIFNDAIRLKVDGITTNPLDGVRRRKPSGERNRRGVPHRPAARRWWTLAEMLAIVRLVRPAYRFAVLLVILTVIRP